MAQINLLPWREEHRREKKKEFLTQLGGVCLLAIGVAYLWVQAVDGAIATQNTRNSMLNTEIGLLEKQVSEIKDLKKKRRELLDRMKVIQDLEGKRSIIVHYFDEFAKSVPDGVYITTLSKNGNIISIDGVSESTNRVSTFMRQLDDSEWFADPNLKSVVAAPQHGSQASTFQMQLKVVLPDDDAKEE
ncbi:PilN domain-containing protein [Teredinibacter purpureus]|jgi:Tfp pilus assembly protein PilN|uniref:PilN domain-containing protein n=1 Tax=Teredinibacter purpureus TaxID=2731756 RepID=UPI0005F807A8|nr:PilN domain-containing protein [Teredinibacter purpureus]